MQAIKAYISSGNIDELYDMGGDIKAVQEYMRHADIETTGNIYTRITAQRKQIYADGLSKVLTLKP